MASIAKKSILSTADVARLFNVTETTVKRWADEGTLRCQKTPGGHRKFEIRNVVEFAEVNHFEPVGTLSIPDEDKLGQRIQVAMLGRDFSELVAAYVEKALSIDKTDLFRFVSYLYQHRVQLWELYDLVIRPGMAEIGERWVRGEIGVNHEHRASYETSSLRRGDRSSARASATTSMRSDSDAHRTCSRRKDGRWHTSARGSRRMRCALRSAR
jgi:excisionase family DNA binding protein